MLAQLRQKLSGAIDQAEHVFEVAPVVTDQADRSKRVRGKLPGQLGKAVVLRQQ